MGPGLTRGEPALLQVVPGPGVYLFTAGVCTSLLISHLLLLMQRAARAAAADPTRQGQPLSPGSASRLASSTAPLVLPPSLPLPAASERDSEPALPTQPAQPAGEPPAAADSALHSRAADTAGAEAVGKRRRWSSAATGFVPSRVIR